MDDFLGNVIKDSLDGASKSHQANAERSLTGQRQVNIAQQEQISEKGEHIRMLKAALEETKKENQNLRSQLLQEKNKNKSKEIPLTLADAVRINNEANKTYRDGLEEGINKTKEEQQKILADWMVSQKAFKELAIQFGLEKGLKLEEIIEMGKNKKIDVLEDNHNPGHKKNASDAPEIGLQKTKLAEEYYNRKS